ncbi:kinase-like protein [Apodospora peruviana]|uniref:Kinase-like protein n=1 Tax=Apodospora peruviana TaxID=516989 RepID=A0AAE0ILI8_9PEZI|nr:kinase-like protein [Apodospora peruviana]
MDDPKTVFCLFPMDKYARRIVSLNPDRECMVDGTPSLRIGLDQESKSPPYLATFGRADERAGVLCDVVLPQTFSRQRQCYFDFNKKTGELLLHDTSTRNDTNLYVAELDARGKTTRGAAQIGNLPPRQCVVLLSPDTYSDPPCPRSWFFKIGKALFHLESPLRQNHDEADFAERRLGFANQPDPGLTVLRTTGRLYASLAEGTTLWRTESIVSYHISHTLRPRSNLEPEEKDKIRYTKLKRLGMGGQGDVHKVVDMSSGDHVACKIVAVKAEVPSLKIRSEREFRQMVEKEVNLVRQLHHLHVVPYIHCQGFTSQNIEIFMPIYRGSVHDLIRKCKSQGPDVLIQMTQRMFFQILDALDFVHTRDPPIIHRDIKPANILYEGNQGDKFLLTDFGIAKVVDKAMTMIGTPGYAAPEVFERGAKQTTKVDIYSFGVTLVECLVKPGDFSHGLTTSQPQQWHRELQRQMNMHESSLVSMLADHPSDRPTARKLLDEHSQPTNAAAQTPQSANQGRETTTPHSPTPTPMDWTATPLSLQVPLSIQPSETVHTSQLN